MKLKPVFAPLLLLSACDSTGSMDPMMSSMSGGVAYEVTLTPMWTAESHPLDYPRASLFSGPHFSGLIGASHGSSYALFEEGLPPTPGLERLSEEGKHAPLDDEIRAAVAAGTVGGLFETGAIKDLSMSERTSVQVSAEFPLVSAVAMIAPSPDWFAGAANVDLRAGGEWVPSREVTLYAFDSGGDDGTSYESADADTSPKKQTRINDAPQFVQDGQRVPVGKLTFRRM